MLEQSFDLTTVLRIIVDVFLVFVLYNILFIVVDLRKITRRIEGITEELETVILKPLSLTDKAIEWISNSLEDKGKHHKDKKHSSK
ncbi:hypothetical protein HYZ98_02175 [Candidatus Peregrinibacteria bacterium]|nr:hypothetical protein [Candidatus Peregrinibacteria bacterium]